MLPCSFYNFCYHSDNRCFPPVQLRKSWKMLVPWLVKIQGILFWILSSLKNSLLERSVLKLFWFFEISISRLKCRTPIKKRLNRGGVMQLQKIQFLDWGYSLVSKYTPLIKVFILGYGIHVGYGATSTRKCSYLEFFWIKIYALMPMTDKI